MSMKMFHALSLLNTLRHSKGQKKKNTHTYIFLSLNLSLRLFRLIFWLIDEVLGDFSADRARTVNVQQKENNLALL